MIIKIYENNNFTILESLIGGDTDHIPTVDFDFEIDGNGQCYMFSSTNRQDYKRALWSDLQDEAGAPIGSTLVEVESFLTTLSQSVGSGGGTDGVDGISAYQSYVNTTLDNPVLTEAVWSASNTAFNGIDDVLNENQSLTADRTITIDGHNFTFSGSSSTLIKDDAINEAIEWQKKQTTHQTNTDGLTVNIDLSTEGFKVIKTNDSNTGDVVINEPTNNGANKLSIGLINEDTVSRNYVFDTSYKSIGGASDIGTITLESGELRFIELQALAITTPYKLVAIYDTGAVISGSNLYSEDGAIPDGVERVISLGNGSSVTFDNGTTISDGKVESNLLVSNTFIRNVFGSSFAIPNVETFKNFRLSVSNTSTGDVTVPLTTGGGLSNHELRFNIDNSDSVSRNIIFDASYQKLGGLSDLGTINVLAGGYRTIDFAYNNNTSKWVQLTDTALAPSEDSQIEQITETGDLQIPATFTTSASWNNSAFAIVLDVPVGVTSDLMSVVYKSYIELGTQGVDLGEIGIFEYTGLITSGNTVGGNVIGTDTPATPEHSVTFDNVDVEYEQFSWNGIDIGALKGKKIILGKRRVAGSGTPRIDDVIALFYSSNGILASSDQISFDNSVSGSSSTTVLEALNEALDNTITVVEGATNTINQLSGTTWTESTSTNPSVGTVIINAAQTYYHQEGNKRYYHVRFYSDYDDAFTFEVIGATDVMQVIGTTQAGTANDRASTIIRSAANVISVDRFNSNDADVRHNITFIAIF